MNVDMAIADTGLDGRHLRVADDRVDQAGTAARDHHVDQPAGLDQMGDAGPVRTGQQLHRIGVEALGGQRGAQRVHQRGVRPRRRRTAAQQNRVARFQRQAERVDGDVRPALVDDADDARAGRAADATAGRWAASARAAPHRPGRAARRPDADRRRSPRPGSGSAPAGRASPRACPPRARRPGRPRWPSGSRGCSSGRGRRPCAGPGSWRRCSASPAPARRRAPGGRRRAPARADHRPPRCAPVRADSSAQRSVAAVARICVVGSVNADLTFTVETLPRAGPDRARLGSDPVPGRQGRQPGRRRRPRGRDGSARRRAGHRCGRRSVARASAGQRRGSGRRASTCPGPSGIGRHRRRRGGRELHRGRAGRERPPEPELGAHPVGDRRQRRGVDLAGDPDGDRDRRGRDRVGSPAPWSC